MSTKKRGSSSSKKPRGRPRKTAARETDDNKSPAMKKASTKNQKLAADALIQLESLSPLPLVVGEEEMSSALEPHPYQGLEEEEKRVLQAIACVYQKRKRQNDASRSEDLAKGIDALEAIAHDQEERLNTLDKNVHQLDEELSKLSESIAKRAKEEGNSSDDSKQLRNTVMGLKEANEMVMKTIEKLTKSTNLSFGALEARMAALEEKERQRN